MLGPPLALVLIVGLVLTGWVRGGLTGNPLNHALLAVISMVPVLLALVGVLLTSSSFLRDLYDIKSLGQAYSFLSRMLFGSWTFRPYLLVKEGEIARGKGTTLHRVGGPGHLVIYHDSVVVTEQCGRLSRILGTGFSRLERFEKVWEIVDLRPQRWVFPVKGMTREGIPVICEADVNLKIDDRVPDGEGRLRPKRPAEKEPYPYDPEAVLRAVTERWVRESGSDGPTMDWVGRVVISFLEGTLRDILAEYRLDWLIAPTGSDTEHPREVIRRRLEEELQEKAAEVGARILRLDLGEIKVEDDRIPRQWIEAWYADWESRALATRVEGEAELLRLDVAQAQAQAELVIRLTDALQSAATSEEELRPYLLATRFVQALRWLAYDPFTRGFMPPEATQTLERLQETLGRERLLREGQANVGEQPEKGNDSSDI